MGFRIAVDDPFVVRRRHRGRDGQHDVRGLLERSRPRHWMKLAGSSPSSSSITRNGCPASLPMSVTSTACGWRTRDVSWASRKKRARASGFAARSGLMILIATFFPIRGGPPRRPHPSRLANQAHHLVLARQVPAASVELGASSGCACIRADKLRRNLSRQRPGQVIPGSCYWWAIARRTRSSTGTRWSWLSSPRSMRTQAMLPFQALPVGP